MIRWVVAAGVAGLLACRREGASEHAPAVVVAARDAEATRDAGGGADADAAVVDAARAGEGPTPALLGDGIEGPSLEKVCAAFLLIARRDAAEIAKNFSFHQSTPRCQPRGPLSLGASSGAFLEARVVDTVYVSREDKRLAVRLARGWVLTSIAWDVSESESATPMWEASAPERVVTDGSTLIAYLGGADVSRNRGTLNGVASPTHAMLRGAFACRDSGEKLTCWKWDPTELPPLGVKIAPAGFKAWPTRPWTEERSLAVRDGRWIVATAIGGAQNDAGAAP